MKYSPAMDSSVQDEKMKYKCEHIYTVDSKSFMLLLQVGVISV